MESQRNHPIPTRRFISELSAATRRRRSALTQTGRPSQQVERVVLLLIGTSMANGRPTGSPWEIFSTDRVWLFRTEEAFEAAQRHASGRHHLVMVTDHGLTASKHARILDAHFDEFTLEKRVAELR